MMDLTYNTKAQELVNAIVEAFEDIERLYDLSESLEEALYSYRKLSATGQKSWCLDNLSIPNKDDIELNAFEYLDNIESLLDNLAEMLGYDVDNNTEDYIIGYKKFSIECLFNKDFITDLCESELGYDWID